MFGIFKKRKIDHSVLHHLKTDFHSHLIPGIDDGAKTIDDSIDLIKGLMNLGITKIITTPHVYYEIYPNTKEIILAGLEKVRKRIREEQLEIELSAAAEYFIDPHFEELLAKKELLPVFENHVLVETSFFQAPPNLEEVIFSMRTKNYIPILAHPERYTHYHQQLAKYERLKSLGCLFQANLLSLSGRYGPQVQKAMESLLKNDMIDYLSSDLHNKDQLQELNQLAYSRILQKWIQKRKFKNSQI